MLKQDVTPFHQVAYTAQCKDVTFASHSFVRRSPPPIIFALRTACKPLSSDIPQLCHGAAAKQGNQQRSGRLGSFFYVPLSLWQLAFPYYKWEVYITLWLPSQAYAREWQFCFRQL